jgi:hypothetical protein
VARGVKQRGVALACAVSLEKMTGGAPETNPVLIAVLTHPPQYTTRPYEEWGADVVLAGRKQLTRIACRYAHVGLDACTQVTLSKFASAFATPSLLGPGFRLLTFVPFLAPSWPRPPDDHSYERLHNPRSVAGKEGFPYIVNGLGRLLPGST